MAQDIAVSDIRAGLYNKKAIVVGWGYQEYDPYDGPNQVKCFLMEYPMHAVTSCSETHSISFCKQGDFASSGVASKRQQKLEMPILSPADCTAKWGPEFKTVESQVCAGGELGKDSCKVRRFRSNHLRSHGSFPAGRLGRSAVHNAAEQTGRSLADKRRRQVLPAGTGQLR